MPQIEIDFEVFKELTSRRATEDFTCNDVIRELLQLRQRTRNGGKSVPNGGKPWIVSDTTFPAGSEFMAEYKGRTHSGVVKDGKLELSDGHKFSTPSAAAVHITNTNVNGWRFWRCKLPGESQYVLAERLRGKSHA
jgi:Restriction Enzyme Adenine Methylase Associated